MQIQLFHSTHSLLKLFRLHFFTSRLNFYRTHFSQQPLPTHLTTTSEFGLFLLLNYSLVRHDFSLLHHSISFFNFLYPTTSTSFRFFRSEFNGVQSEFDSERFPDIVETFLKTFENIPDWTPVEFSRTLREFDPNIGTTLTFVTSTTQKTSKVGFSVWPTSSLNSPRVQQSSVELWVRSLPRYHRNIFWYFRRHTRLNSGRVQPNSNGDRPKYGYYTDVRN